MRGFVEVGLLLVSVVSSSGFARGLHGISSAVNAGRAVVAASVVGAGELEFTKFGSIEKDYAEFGKAPGHLAEVLRLMGFEVEVDPGVRSDVVALRTAKAQKLRCYDRMKPEVVRHMALAPVVDYDGVTNPEAKGFRFDHEHLLKKGGKLGTYFPDEAKARNTKLFPKPVGQVTTILEFEPYLNLRRETSAFEFKRYDEKQREFNSDVRFARMDGTTYVLLKDVLSKSDDPEDRELIGKTFRYCIGEIEWK